MSSLEAILHEIQQMDNAIRDAAHDHVADADRRRLRRDVNELRHRVLFLMD